MFVRASNYLGSLMADTLRRGPEQTAAAIHTPRELSGFGVLLLLMGAFLPIADFFIVNVALHSIDDSLRASPATLELVVAGYGIAYAALLVLGGRLGDRFGRRRMFLAALVGFVLASLACGLAPTIGALIAARLVQGASAALLVPQVLATFHATLDGERKARALAMYGATSGIAAVVGQLAGGLLVTADIAGTDWRPIFLVNVPIGAVVILFAGRVVPATRSPHPGGIDMPGTLLFAATLTALLIPLTEGHSLGWPAWAWVLLAGVPVLAVTGYLVESRIERNGDAPLLPPSLIKLPSMWKGLSMILPFSIGFGAFMFVFALTVQGGLHADALHSGLAILPMAILFFLGSLVSPRSSPATVVAPWRPVRWSRSWASVRWSPSSSPDGRTSACSTSLSRWRSPAPDSPWCSPACSASSSPTARSISPASAEACSSRSSRVASPSASPPSAACTWLRRRRT